MKLILILVRTMKKKNIIQVDNNGEKYILFRIDVYFTKYCLAVEIDEKSHTDKDPIFEQKRQDVLEKKLNCTFIRTNTSKVRFNADHEVSKIEMFISQFKNNKIEEIKNKNKKLKDKIKERDDKRKERDDKIKKVELQLANLNVKNNEINDKK